MFKRKLKNPGALLPDITSKDAHYELLIGSEGEVQPRWFTHTMASWDYIYQGNKPECVPATICFIQQRNTAMETNKKVPLSARWIFNRGGGSKIGMYINVACEIARKEGIMPDKYYNNDVSLPWYSFKKLPFFSKPQKDEALNFKIKNWSYIPIHRKDLIKEAIRKMPLMFVAGGNNKDWKADIIKKEGEIDWYHAFEIHGWDEDEQVWYGMNWWKNEPHYIKLSMDYPITHVISFEDLPDEWQFVQENYLTN